MTRLNSGIIFTRYAQNHKIGNLKSFRARKQRNKLNFNGKYI